MDPFASYRGTADGLYERVVNHVVVSGQLALRTLDPGVVYGRLPGGADVLIVRWTEPPPDLRAMVPGVGPHGLEIVVVGGGADARAGLEEALPTSGASRVWAWHLPEGDAPISVANPGGTLGGFLAPPDGPPDWVTFERVAMALAGAAHAEGASFQALVAGRSTPLTYTLLGIIGLVYGLEVSRGAMEDPMAMLSLGALHRESVFRGEVWRLVSATFLHGNLVHLLFNGFVLYSLGTTLERLLGGARFLLLYTASALGGSLLSLVFLEGMSVGASGALWGLMAAEFLLAVRDQGFLPEPVRASLKQGAGQNLILNVLASFRPGVDWAAHAGGGLVGAALVLAGVMTAGLPRWVAGEGRAADVVPLAVRRAAGVSAGILLVGLAVGVLAGQLIAPPPYAG